MPRRLLAAAIASGLLLGPLAACQRPRPRATRIVLSLSGSAGRPVHGLDLTIALPKGASAEIDPATGRVSPAAIAAGEAAPRATVDAHFVSRDAVPSFRVLVASQEPMRDGPVAVISLTVVSAITPPRDRFEVARAAVSGAGGALLPGATGWVSAVEVR